MLQESPLRAKLTGLIAKPELNGSLVEVKRFMPAKQRYEVRIHAEESTTDHVDRSPDTADLPSAADQAGSTSRAQQQQQANDSLSIKAGNLDFLHESDSAQPPADIAILPIDGRGLGVVALRDFDENEKVFDDPSALSNHRGGAQGNPDWTQAEVDKLYKQFEGLSDGKKQEVAGLVNKAKMKSTSVPSIAGGSSRSHDETHPLPTRGELAQLFATNSFTMRPNNAPEGTKPVDQLFPKASRINHSCRPNVHHFITPGNMEITTTRPIKKGDELFFTYIGFWHDSETRKNFLHQYKFDCQCEVCALPLDLLKRSDERRREYDKKEDKQIEATNEARELMGKAEGRKPPSEKEKTLWVEVLRLGERMLDLRREEGCMEDVEPIYERMALAKGRLFLAAGS